MKRISNNHDPRVLRRKLRMNQEEFWSLVGVTQSGGSRYESGRRIPRPVQALLRLVHVEGIDLAQVDGNDIRVAKALKREKPELYRRLRKTSSQTGNSPSR